MLHVSTIHSISLSLRSFPTFTDPNFSFNSHYALTLIRYLTLPNWVIRGCRGLTIGYTNTRMRMLVHCNHYILHMWCETVTTPALVHCPSVCPSPAVPQPWPPKNVSTLVTVNNTSMRVWNIRLYVTSLLSWIFASFRAYLITSFEDMGYGIWDVMCQLSISHQPSRYPSVHSSITPSESAYSIQIHPNLSYSFLCLFTQTFLNWIMTYLLLTILALNRNAVSVISLSYSYLARQCRRETQPKLYDWRLMGLNLNRLR
jgi:hypothetical protein